MNIEKLKKDLAILRGYHQAGMELADRILQELESESPAPRKKRKNLKLDREVEAHNYVTQRRWGNKNSKL